MVIPALPLWLGYWIQWHVLGPAQAISDWSQIVGLVPSILGVYLRQVFYRGILPYVGPDASIGFGVLLASSSTRIGKGAYIGPYCVLGDVDVGDDVLFGSAVSIINGARQHGTERLDIPVREQPGEWPRISIGRDSWIGDRAVVMADIGAHCVVGAGAVVTKPVPDYAIVVGNPARIVKYRNETPATRLARSS